MTDVMADAPAPGPSRVRAWDIAVRVFHWSLATAILLNLTAIDEESRLHELVGYAAAGLVAFRVVWGLIGTRTARFSAFPPSISAASRHLADLLAGRRETPHLSHNPLGAWMVYNLLATVSLIAATGIMMTSTAFWGVEWVEEVHEALANWLIASVVLHVAGVIFESRRSGVNLVQAMVTGWKTMSNRLG